MSSLRYLTINHRFENQLFHLYAYLPSIASFRVNIHSNYTNLFQFINNL